MVRREMIGRIPSNVFVYKTGDDSANQMKFYGESTNENPMEFLIECEHAMATVGDTFSDTDKID